MRVLGLVVALLSSVVFAQGNTGQSTTGVSRGNGLRIPQYRTAGTGTNSYFVATTGNDANDCRAVGTPCLTIQGATNKIPKLLRDQVTVNVAAGTYAGFYISGFSADTGVQQTSAGLFFDGALANWTPATGTATGTATAGSAGSGAAGGTLTDAAQTWTVNDLRGRFITVTASGQTRMISSNTATVITILGTWTSPAGSAYAVQTPSVIINTVVANPPTPINTAGAGTAGISTNDNNMTWKPGAISIRNMEIASPGTGFRPNDGSFYSLSQMRIDTSATASAAAIALTSGAFIGPGLAIVDSYLRSHTAAAIINSADTNFTLNANRTFFHSGTYAITSSNSVMYANVGSGITLSEFFDQASGGIIMGAGSLARVSNTRVTCNTSAGIAFTAGALAGASTPVAGSSLELLATNTIATCGFAVRVAGPSTAYLSGNALTGTVATTAYDVYNGGFISLSTTATVTGTTQDINLDNGALTAAFADVATGTCVGSAQQGSRVCKQ